MFVIFLHVCLFYLFYLITFFWFTCSCVCILLIHMLACFIYSHVYLFCRYKIIYKRYASLYFAMCVDVEDNELIALEVRRRGFELRAR